MSSSVSSTQRRVWRMAGTRECYSRAGTQQEQIVELGTNSATAYSTVVDVDVDGVGKEEGRRRRDWLKRRRYNGHQ